MRRHTDGDVLWGREPRERYVAGPQTDASAADLVCGYEDAALPVKSIVHGWAKSQPIRDEYNNIINGFLFHTRPVRGGWRCSRVTLGPHDPREVPRYTRCHHERRPGHDVMHDMHRGLDPAQVFGHEP